MWGLGQFVFGAALWSVAFFVGIRVLHIFGPLFLLMGLLKIASIPDNMKVILQHGGNQCPECDAWNELHWYN